MRAREGLGQTGAGGIGVRDNRRQVAVTVAIVVPSLNQGQFLGAALASIFAQSEPMVRVAVMDGGSRDRSLDELQAYAPRLAYWRSGPDGGQAAAINEGVERVGMAEYVGWLNADDVLLPGALARLSAHLAGHPCCVPVFGPPHIYDADGGVIGDFPTRPFTRRRLSRTSIICQPASLIRRSAWTAVGGLDESLNVSLDYDLWWRLSQLGSIDFVPEFVACSRDHESTKTRRQQDRMYAESFAIVRRHLGYVPWRWCLSEAAYRWRTTHDGRRASTPVSQLVCAGRALVRYVGLNGLSGLARRAAGPPAPR